MAVAVKWMSLELRMLKTDGINAKREKFLWKPPRWMAVLGTCRKTVI